MAGVFDIDLDQPGDDNVSDDELEDGVSFSLLTYYCGRSTSSRGAGDATRRELVDRGFFFFVVGATPSYGPTSG